MLKASRRKLILGGYGKIQQCLLQDWIIDKCSDLVQNLFVPQEVGKMKLANVKSLLIGAVFLMLLTALSAAGFEHGNRGQMDADITDFSMPEFPDKHESIATEQPMSPQGPMDMSTFISNHQAETTMPGEDSCEACQDGGISPEPVTECDGLDCGKIPKIPDIKVHCEGADCEVHIFPFLNTDHQCGGLDCGDEDINKPTIPTIPDIKCDGVDCGDWDKWIPKFPPNCDAPDCGGHSWPPDWCKNHTCPDNDTETDDDVPNNDSEASPDGTTEDYEQWYVTWGFKPVESIESISLEIGAVNCSNATLWINNTGTNIQFGALRLRDPENGKQLLPSGNDSDTIAFNAGILKVGTTILTIPLPVPNVAGYVAVDLVNGNNTLARAVKHIWLAHQDIVQTVI